MPLNRTLWSALWDRAAREELGVVLRFSDTASARVQLNQNRPPAFHDYTICSTRDPAILIIVRPGVTLNDETDAHAAKQIFADLE